MRTGCALRVGVAKNELSARSQARDVARGDCSLELGTTRASLCAVVAALLLCVAGCSDDLVSPESTAVAPIPIEDFSVEDMWAKNGLERATFGDPLSRLSPALVARFQAGKDEFEQVETADEGLGPVFNGASCVECHDQGATGGPGTGVETRFGRRGADGRFDPLPQLGGSLLQSQGITYGDCSQPPEEVPAEANVVAGRQTTSLFGAGLLEAIPSGVLLVLADPYDRNHDGISGRPNWVVNPASRRLEIGRFGWKAQVSSLLTFSGDAYLNELGVTTNLFPRENLPQGGAPVCDDGLPGEQVEDGDEDGDGISDALEPFSDFMRLLAPPPLAGLPSLAAIRGARVFVGIQCASCHWPAYVTGYVRDMPALSWRDFYPFTDLLLHDMGSLGDGIEQGQARGREMRTPPLWGLRASGPYLHDGRATTIEDAILGHDGEASRSREAFSRLPPAQRADLLAFLRFI